MSSDHERHRKPAFLDACASVLLLAARAATLSSSSLLDESESDVDGDAGFLALHFGDLLISSTGLSACFFDLFAFFFFTSTFSDSESELSELFLAAFFFSSVDFVLLLGGAFPAALLHLPFFLASSFLPVELVDSSVEEVSAELLSLELSLTITESFDRSEL